MKNFRTVLKESIISSNPELDDKVIDFVLTTLYFSTQTHIYHLLTKSYAEHVAIGEFYECLTGLADSIAEKSIGLGMNENPKDTPMTVTFSYTKGKLINDLSSYRSYVNSMLLDTNDSNIMSINDDIIDIQKAVDTLLYKLQLN